MTATPTRAGTMTHDYEVAAVTFDSSDKNYHYWVPKQWKLNPGDKITVITPNSGLTVVTVVHSGQMAPLGNHKMAERVYRRKPVKVTDPPPIRITGEEGTLADTKLFVHGDRGFDDQMAYYRQAFERSRRPHTIPAAQPKDTAMEIQNQTLVNGRNIKDMSDDQLFDLIAAEEAKIKALRAIENKPQKLKDRINKMQADIEHLIQLIDER